MCAIWHTFSELCNQHQNDGRHHRLNDGESGERAQLHSEAVEPQFEHCYAARLGLEKLGYALLQFACWQANPSATSSNDADASSNSMA